MGKQRDGSNHGLNPEDLSTRGAPKVGQNVQKPYLSLWVPAKAIDDGANGDASLPLTTQSPAATGSGATVPATGSGRRGWRFWVGKMLKAKYWAFIYLLRTKTDDHQPVEWQEITSRLVSAYKVSQAEAKEIIATYRAQ